VRSPERNAILTVGAFDGVHRGHQAILEILVERARARGGTPTLVSFDPHPREVVRGETVPLLTTAVEKAALVGMLGVERTVVLPFDRAMSRMSAEEFVQHVLVDQVGMKAIVIGHDHGFGAGRRGNRDLLEKMAPELGFEVDVISAEQVEDVVVSSSTIRKILAEDGDVGSAMELLGRPYRWRGTVIEGAKRGRTIGYPTANLLAEESRKLVPLPGVYGVVVTLPTAARVGGMMNIGIRPTFGGQGLHQEVHLFDFSENLYGQVVTVEFRERLRGERRFDGIPALAEQLNLDESRCRRLLDGVV
jgi:riboflavin kinase / FMN adenylyltransferase